MLNPAAAPKQSKPKKQSLFFDDEEEDDDTFGAPSADLFGDKPGRSTMWWQAWVEVDRSLSF
jgi:hypothetical protein